MTDAYIMASGRNLEESFQNAALAMFDTMTDVKDVEEKMKDEFQVEGFDECSLLYNWLESLLVKLDIDGRVYSRFHIKPIERSQGRLFLRADVYGETFDSSRHRRKVEVKAVTYHRMEVEKSQDGVCVKYILDL